MEKYSCLVPFYNEGERIIKTLKELGKSRLIGQIMAVDDGSTDSSSDVIRRIFPNVTLIRYPKNKGKSAAVAVGVKKAKFRNIILIDGDLNNLKVEEIDPGLELFLTSGKYDMIIFRRKKLLPHVKVGSLFFRRDLVESGIRILKKHDLVESLKLAPQRYQLEMAINLHLMRQNKKASWMYFSATNTSKVKKGNFFKGVLREIKMNWEFYSFNSLIDSLKMSWFFAREKI